jgi:hypothetical protein
MALVQRIQQKFGRVVHRRSLKRALVAVKKNSLLLDARSGSPGRPCALSATALTEHYESARAAALGLAGEGSALTATLMSSSKPIPSNTNPATACCAP